jgi:hypothetical protein
MRKSTLVLVVIAAAVVGFVYWHEFKRAPAEKTKTHPAVFKFQPEQVATITIRRPGRTIVIERQGTGWQITQPVDTRADKNAVKSLLNDVTLAHAAHTLTPSGNQLKAFGLETPAATLAFKLEKGKEHRLKLGSADFSGNSAYAQADGSKEVVLVPASLLQDGKKTVQALRDNSVLGISSDAVQSFDLKTPSGAVDVRRVGSGESTSWSIEKPLKAGGDPSAISTLLSNVSSAKLSKVVSESAKDLARYGLTRPAISFAVNLKSGGQRALELGRKQGDQYYARDTSRNMVFLVPASVEKQLDQSLYNLRDKQILHGLPGDFTRIDYTAGSLQFSCGVDSKGHWTMFTPASDKGKEVANWKIFNPLTSASAEQVIDHPPASLMAQVAHPAIQIVLTRKKGGRETFRLSKPSGKSAYIWVSSGSGLYRIAKSTYDSLLFKSAKDILR